MCAPIAEAFPVSNVLCFSVIVPTYQRPESLERLIAALTQQTYSSSLFEVVLIDDGGEVRLDTLVSRYRSELNIALLRQPHGGPAAARNRGAGHSSGRCLAFTDDDCSPEPAWLESLSHALGDSDRVLCGGKVVNALPDNIYSDASQLLADYLCARYSPASVSGGFFPSNNLALSRETFNEAGGFDASLRFGEDRDFCYRCASLGCSFVFVPQAVVRHAHAQQLISFLRLHGLYGSGTYYFRAGCARKGLPRVGISSPLWYLDMVLSGLRKKRGIRGAKLSLLLAAAQAAGAIGMARGWLSRKREREKG
jgi:glycosyltransferase involved in cell wall biosynthesis